MNKNVLNKLSKIESKVELAEVKVDLALMDDIKKLHQQSIDLKKKASPYEKEALDISNRARVIVGAMGDIDKETSKIESTAQQVFNNFKKQASDLGLDIKNSEANKLYEEILSNLLTTPQQKGIKDIIGQWS